MISRNKAAVLVALACFLASTLAGTPALAEISAEFDQQGNYIRMIYITNPSARNLRIWSPLETNKKVRTIRNRTDPLNPEGDILKDSWPFYLENRFEGNRPCLVWSRFNGNDYDLVWTRLLEDGVWAPINWVESTAHPGMEQGPYLASHPEDGRPHLVWWSDEDGIGRVYLSIFLESSWMERFLVSDPGVDSRYPVIDFLQDDQIQVTYHTPDGKVSRMITLTSNSPDTIRDDLDPMTGVGSKDDPAFRTKSTPDD